MITHPFIAATLLSCCSFAHGTRFEYTVPIAHQEVFTITRPTHTTQEWSMKITAPSNPIEPDRILILDDSSTTLSVANELLYSIKKTPVSCYDYIKWLLTTCCVLTKRNNN